MIHLHDINACVVEIAKQLDCTYEEVICNTYVLADDREFLKANQYKNSSIILDTANMSWSDTIILLPRVGGFIGDYKEYHIQAGLNLGMCGERFTYAKVVVPIIG